MMGYGRRLGDMKYVCKCLTKGGMDKDEIYQVLEIINKSINPNIDNEVLSFDIWECIKWADKFRSGNISDEVRAWVSVTDGDFSVTNCYNSLLSVTGVTNRDNIRQILHRLKDEGVIIKVGQRDGWYRRVNGEAPEINWLDADESYIDIVWPFGIEKWVKTMPKNIIIIAGSPDAGKTAFLLNVVQMNMHKLPINYFSSEMGKSELKTRLLKFDFQLKAWKFKAIERSSSFADVIKPNEINIIDYLELTGAEGSEFYKVGAFIKEIYDKLNEGIAIIAIQKQFKSDLARGGIGSLEKARLYLSIENGKMKIIKAKNWASEFNPNDMEFRFKLVQGAKFIEQFKEDNK